MREKFKILVLLLFLGSQSYGQSLTIKGTVTDDKGQTLPGATVVLVGTTQGTITDLDGKYTLSAAPGGQLKYSFIGFLDQTKTIGKELVINIQMVADTKAIDEVVIVGYGTQKKATAVGSISQTTSTELKRQGNITNMTDALGGSIPGVTVLASTGIPGGGGDTQYSKASGIFIRGINTWNDASPLILVDGIERKMNDLEINEIESFTVLKDASATAVFGMKGANGVILITTKRGRMGKPKLSFDASKTFETISKYSQVVNSYKGHQARNYAILNEVDLVPASWQQYSNTQVLEHYRLQDMPYAYPDIDWRELMLRDYGSSDKVSMNIAGGTNFVKYFGSISYLHEGDVMNTKDIGRGYDPAFAYNRFNVRSNYDFTLSKTTKLAVNIAGIYGRQKMSGASYHSLYQSIYGSAPDAVVIRYEDGIFGSSLFPVDLLNSNEYESLNSSGTIVSNRFEVNSDFALDQNLDFITKGLSIKGKLAYDNYSQTNGPNVTDNGYMTKVISRDFYLAGGKYNVVTKQYEMNGVPVDMAAYTTYTFSGGTNTNGFEPTETVPNYNTETVSSGSTRYSLVYELSMNYARDFGKHGVTALALFSRQKSEAGSNWPDKREDWVGRLTYDYNTKYFAEINGAYNGTQRFGPGYKFDFFPSLAVGWNVSNENFIKNNLQFIQSLKIKYSNGMVGNDRVGAGNWPYLTTWNAGNPIGNDGGSSNGFGVSRTPTYARYYEGTPGNANLRWEKANKQNLGVEFTLYKGLITGSLDLFKEHRFDMLIAGNQRTIAPTFGQTFPPDNIGELKSQGMELQGTVAKSYKNGFNFSIGGSWTNTRNKILDKEDALLKPFYQKAAGYPIGQIRITKETSLMNSWDDVYNGAIGNGSNVNRLPGDFVMMDYNANGKIDPDDSAPYGYTLTPQSTYTINLNVGYKGLSLAVLFYGDHNVTREVGLGVFSQKIAAVHQIYLDATATPEFGNANPTFPQLNMSRGSGSGSFNQWDGSLFRLKNIELSYTLPKKWMKSMNVSTMRFFANGNNLIVWTKMPNDGEGATSGDLGGRHYPLKRIATVALNIQF